MRVKTTQSVGYIRFEKALDYGEIKNILESSQVEVRFNPKKRTTRKEAKQPTPRTVTIRKEEQRHTEPKKVTISIEKAQSQI
jgi:hypothetical protein